MYSAGDQQACQDMATIPAVSTNGQDEGTIQTAANTATNKQLVSDLTVVFGEINGEMYAGESTIQAAEDQASNDCAAVRADQPLPQSDTYRLPESAAQQSQVAAAQQSQSDVSSAQATLQDDVGTLTSDTATLTADGIPGLAEYVQTIQQELTNAQAAYAKAQSDPCIANDGSANPVTEAATFGGQYKSTIDSGIAQVQANSKTVSTDIAVVNEDLAALQELNTTPATAAPIAAANAAISKVAPAIAAAQQYYSISAQLQKLGSSVTALRLSRTPSPASCNI